MPPKKSKQIKAKKGKDKAAGADGKNKLWDKIMALREELEQTKKQKNSFRRERDDMMASWEKSKRLLEELRAQHREKVREMNEREKHLQDRLKQVHTQLARVKLEHNNAISEMKIQAVRSQGKMMNEFMERELALYQESEALQAALLEINSNVDKCLKATMLKHEEAIMEMKDEYDHIHKQKQTFHLEKSQKIKSEHAQLLQRETYNVFDDMHTKCCLENQAFEMQWKILKYQAMYMNNKKEPVQPSVHELSVSVEISEVPANSNSPHSSEEED